MTNDIQNKYKIVIVDDDQKNIDSIRTSLEAYPETVIAETTNDAYNAPQVILTAKPDLLFIDVEMPLKTGLDIVAELEGRIVWKMQIVFYTAYDKYLLDALRSSAFDFLLKPYTEPEFANIMSRFFKKNKEDTPLRMFNEQIKQLVSKNDRFLITTESGIRLLKTNEIVYFEYESIRKIWSVFTWDEKKFSLKRGQTADDILNYSATFAQISQYLILNLDFLSSIEDSKCMLLPPYNRRHLKISRTFLKSFIDKFENI
ncbi:MAG: LytTR family DNA-binding domain-containing protein [Paludibacteraceae bacterium]